MAQLTVEQALEMAVSFHRMGQLPQAENLYQQILVQEPGHIDALHLLGVIAQQRGRNDVAVTLIGQALSMRPDWPEAQNNLGNALKAQGLLDQAITAYLLAIQLRPDFAEAHNNLGNALRDKGQLPQAIAAFRTALTLAPDYAQACNNLANILRETGQLDEAIDAYRQAIALLPDYADAHNNLGIALRDKGQLDDAVISVQKAIALNPAHTNAYSSLGNVLKDKGELDQAIAAYRNSIKIAPDNADAHSNLGEALRQAAMLDDAIDACKKAILLNPHLPEAHNNLGNALRNHGKYEEAIAAYQQAIALRADYAQAFCNLGNAQRDSGKADDALATFKRAISLEPDDSNAHNSLGNALKDRGELSDAIAAYRQAVALDPGNAAIHSNLLLALNYLPDCDSPATAKELERWNQRHAKPFAKSIQPHVNDRDPQRRLRIGYVSPDFRNHAVGRNIMPLFSHHDHQQFEICCYAQVQNPDEMTREFKRNSDRWRTTAGLSDDQLARQIRDDQIDILVDLALHTGGNRLPVFARKPAPVQATFAGYPGSTGLTAIDYRLSDPYLDPIGMDESIYSEKTVRLPDSFWCYDPLDCRDVPVSSLPALDSGIITFGCLNNYCKVNDEVLGLWARILKKIESSRLILLSPEGDHRNATVQYFGQFEIQPNRIEFVPPQSHRRYLDTYHRIDIGLDTFPYNGHTTSLDSFWMGVPVISLVGTRVVNRAGLCQLSNLGLQELAAHTPDQFVRIACELANDLPRLQQLRSTLRLRMEKSPLMDASKFARSIESAYRQMWQNWCAV